jgi:hypothetical protein
MAVATALSRGPPYFRTFEFSSMLKSSADPLGIAWERLSRQWSLGFDAAIHAAGRKSTRRDEAKISLLRSVCRERTIRQRRCPLKIRISTDLNTKEVSVLTTRKDSILTASAILMWRFFPAAYDRLRKLVGR